MIAPFMLFVFLLITGRAEVNFVAGGFDAVSSGRTMAWSQDGTGWTPVSASPFLDSCSGVAYSANRRKWLALGSGSNTMAFSLDGKNWVGLGTSVFSTQGNRIHYSSVQDKWVATGLGANNIAYSLDGTNWNLATTVFTIDATDVVFAPAVSKWVAVGSGTNNIAHSPDGITWTGLGLSIFGIGGKGLSVDFEPSNTQFIVGGLSASFPYGVSQDGVIWSGRVGLFSNQVTDAAYGQGKWIITGPATPLPTPFANSSDAVSGSWTLCLPQTVITNGKALVYHPQYDRWVAIGSGSNHAIYSSDGDDWIAAGTPFQTAGFHVATTGTFLVLPSSLLSGSITGTVNVNSSAILANATVDLQGSLVVAGDLYVLGSLTVEANATLNVTGTLTVTGSLVFVVSSNQTILIESQTLLVDGASLTLVLPAPLTQTLTVTIAEYAANAGTFTLGAVQFLQPNAQCLSQTPQYSSTALSVTVAITSCPPESDAVSTGSPSGTPASTPFPVWAIAVIVVACVAVGVTAAIVIIVLTRRQINFYTETNRAELKAKEVEKLQTALRVTRGNAPPE